VERFGNKVKHNPPATTDAEATGEEAVAAAPEAKPEDEEDARPWVVKVVKREATIGAHTFHLHEIYGLTTSSSSTHTHAPTAPLPSSHTYPPAGAPVAEHGDSNDDSPSECLLCLSSPREVVLLPCRHLVACKDCALNMVEFGAGGNITQPTDEPATTGDGATESGEGGAAGTGGEATGIQAPLQTRRKRKAKGWFCPVCRQPYTSLLRITTTPPSAHETKTDTPSSANEGSDDDHTPDQDIADADLSSGLPLPVTAESAQPQTAADANSSGLFTRPGFLRGLGSRNASRGDLESQL